MYFNGTTLVWNGKIRSIQGWFKLVGVNIVHIFDFVWQYIFICITWWPDFLCYGELRYICFSKFLQTGYCHKNRTEMQYPHRSFL